ncbi:MAG: trifunctional transcriptional activator/DNA repair protein Ada/methylated-DNA--[protein]-cysteine S-methyltransferase [Pseudomonadota bacterium]
MDLLADTEDQLYTALVNRDPSHDGRWFVGVRTTGIFCRSTCPARKPKRENCEFYATPAACIQAGYRPCKRCHPLGAVAEQHPLTQDLTERLQAEPDRRWCEDDLVALGYDPSTVRRCFRQHFGLTFLQLARQARLGQGFTKLGKPKAVINAQLEAGYDSASGFREAFANWMGVSPGALKANARLRAEVLDTPVGDMIAIGDADHLHLLEFFDRRALKREAQRLFKFAEGDIGLGETAITQRIRRELGEFFAGTRRQFEVPIHLHGTPFQQTVWRALCDIPIGETRSYAQLAQAIGKPTAMRAVARANGANQLAIIVPCHRVIGADGSLTGYGGGLWRKQKLIELERNAQLQQMGQAS